MTKFNHIFIKLDMSLLLTVTLIPSTDTACAPPPNFLRSDTSFDVHISGLMGRAAKDDAEAECVSQGAELFSFEQPGDIAVIDQCKIR